MKYLEGGEEKKDRPQRLVQHRIRRGVGAEYFSRSYDNSSSGVNLTPYSGLIFERVILTPKRSLKNSFSGVKSPPILIRS